MTSSYLEKPLRTYQEAAKDLESMRDHQPDLIFNHDALEWGEHRAIVTGHTVRNQTCALVASMKRRSSKTDEEIAWLRQARKAHSKAILDREAYRAAIREREIQRELGL